ncbi:hypothetical protein Q2K19_22400 [Micromonospora soli]|uniref:alpha/beta hydrolase family protein n=1 Tax=Micromonospora sp. NBRC 110009 TaxID=3061627 RepID=UPI002670E607|nr:hypothetical protein [Micromonospora sp. NBRC 110009]WKT96921.1 hypothetical protein Q2K19_22400 [Micromonospora sp. NBRC 110009]
MAGGAEAAGHTGEPAARRRSVRHTFAMDDEPRRSVISVMLIVADAAAAVAWYKSALGATDLWDLSGVAGLEIDGAPFFLHEADPRKATEFVDEATSLAERGMTALLTAYRLPPHGDQRAWADAVRAAVLTQRRGLDVLTAWADRLCYFGHSGGAALGAILSAVEPRLFALALASYGSGTLKRIAAASLPQNDPVADAYVEFLHRFEPASYVAVPGARRLLFQHRSDDEIVYLSEGLRLFDAAAEPKEWREYPCGHDTSTPPQARADRVRLFAATPQ